MRAVQPRSVDSPRHRPLPEAGFPWFARSARFWSRAGHAFGPVWSRSALIATLYSGVGSALTVASFADVHEGRAPVSAHAACEAAPSATYSPDVGTTTEVCVTAETHFAVPSTERLLRRGVLAEQRLRSLRLPAIRRLAPRDRFDSRAQGQSGGQVRQANAAGAPHGHRVGWACVLPRKGNSVSASSSDIGTAASSSNVAKSTPRSVRTVSRTCPALRVQNKRQKGASRVAEARYLAGWVGRWSCGHDADDTGCPDGHHDISHVSP